MADETAAKLLGMLGMCKRAGKLTAGFDTVTEGVRMGTIRCVFYASDVSEKTVKELRYVCEQEGAEVIALPVTMDEIGKAAAKRSGVLAVTDAGLRRKISGMILSDGGKI